MNSASKGIDTAIMIPWLYTGNYDMLALLLLLTLSVELLCRWPTL